MKTTKWSNRVLSFVMAVIMVLSMVPAAGLHVHAEEAVANNARAVTGGTCGEDLTWSLAEDGTLTIAGTGEMDDYTYSSSAPWGAYKNQIVNVVIEAGATTVGNYAFYNYDSLLSVTIPDSVTTIGGSAFGGCNELANVTIGAGVTVIDEFAFSGCTALASVTFPNGLTTIGEDAFSSCTSLTTVSIPASVTTIGVGAFAQCYSLTEIVVHQDNTAYSNDMDGVLFNKDQTILVQAPGAITGIYTVPETVTAIGDWAFSTCGNLTGVVMGSAVADIGDYAFHYCDALTEITFSGNAPAFGYDVFDMVTASAYYPPNDATWTEDVMQNYGGEITWSEFDPCAKGHTEVTDAAVAPDCVNTGLTEGKHCSVCGEVTVAQTVIPALGHDMVTDAGYAATCTTTGLTDGAHCSRCDAATTAQEVIPALGHDFEDGVCGVCGAEEVLLVFGDANGDGFVDTIDAMLVLQYATYSIEGDALDLAASDVNGDGVVDTVDAMLVLQYATYLIDVFPVETEE